MEEKKYTHLGISASILKLLALISMCIDHFAVVLLYRVINSSENQIRTYLVAHCTHYEVVLEFLQFIYPVLRAFGRISFPLFCFFIVEGFLNTKSRKKYAFRLLILAVLSEIPFDFAILGQISDFSVQNIYFTLVIGLGAIWGINALREKAKYILKPVWHVVLTVSISIFACMLSGILHTDYPVIGVLSIILIYIIRMESDSKFYEVLCIYLSGILLRWLLSPPALIWEGIILSMFGLICLIYISRKENKLYAQMGLAGVAPLLMIGFSEIFALITPLYLINYNGQRGFGGKWFFYFFYPIHLLAFAIIASIFGIIKL